VVNSELLNSQLRSTGVRKDYIASVLHISKATLSNKINNKTEFRSTETFYIKKLLGLSDDLYFEIFFADSCDSKSQKNMGSPDCPGQILRHMEGV